MRPWGAWRPDVFDLDTQFAGEALGVLPGLNSYRPWPSLSTYSTALAAVCRGGCIAVSSSGSYSIFAGTATKLYKFDSTTLGWTDVTRAAGGDYTVADDERWQFAQFGFYLYATQIGDVLQRFDIDSGTNFAAVSGSPPQARYVRTIGDQLFLGSLTSFPNRIHFSGRNNPVFWTAGGGQDCDIQDFPDGGFVRGMTGRQGGMIFQDTAVRQFVPSSGRDIYKFAWVEDSQGLLAPDSLVSHQGTSYYLGTDGFVSISPAGSKSIGLETVDEWFQDEVDVDRASLTMGALDPIRPRLYWLFSSGVSGYVLNRCICYDILLDKWTHAEFDASVIFPAASAGYTLEGLDADFPDLDAMSISLDSRLFAGGTPLLAAFGSSHRLSFFTGTPQAATVETGEFRLIPGRRAYVRGVTLMADASNATVQASSREALDDAPVWSSVSSLNSSGIAPVRSSGRYHRIRASVAAGEDWNHLHGVEPDFVDAGGR